MINLILTIVVSFVHCKVIHPVVPGGKITVHVVPHSHNDVGWLFTVEQYYDGQGSHVKQIISSYIKALLDDPNKKFS